MQFHETFYLEAVAAILTVLAAVLPWLWRWTTRINIAYRSIEHLYSNGIPHINLYLEKICEKLGIEYRDVEPPSLLDISNGKGK